MSNYPEHDKLALVSDRSQICGEFLDWLAQQGIELGKWHYHTDKCWGESSFPICGISSEQLYPLSSRINDLLAQFFDIDQNKIEAEKRAMLEELREVTA